MSDGNNGSGGGVGFFGLLAIVFIACKITGFIDWPWWLVLSPIWGSLLFVVVIAIVAAVAAVISEIKR